MASDLHLQEAVWLHPVPIPGVLPCVLAGFHSALAGRKGRVGLRTPGAPLQFPWKLKIPETVRKRVRKLTWNTVGGIHRGRDKEGHIQAVCRNQQGWLVFDDMKEATQYDAQPPFADDWACIWLIQFSWVRCRSPSYWLRGLNSITVRTALEYSKHVWRLEEYPKNRLEHMQAHCMLCGSMVLSYSGLQAHIRDQHPEFLYVLHRTQQRQDFHEVMSLPCTGCGAQTNLGHKPWAFVHRCTVALNLNLGIGYQRAVLTHVNPQFRIPTDGPMMVYHCMGPSA